MPRNGNRLLASLSTDDFDLLEAHLQSVILGLRKGSVANLAGGGIPGIRTPVG
jgi:hypothetical protein